MKPIIGITTFEEDSKGYHSVKNTYIDAVFAAGGIPINIPMIEDEEDYQAYANLIDGIIFTGGPDILPLIYGENPIKEIGLITSRRDEYELGLFKKVYQMEKPILGICRGSQLMNVALGGNLYQDINVQVANTLGHVSKSTSADEFYHQISIVEDSRLYKIFEKKKINVNSYHHQAIKELGNDLRVIALSEDGIIEGIEGTGRGFVLGLQFHPEALAPRYPEYLKIFTEFILAAKN
ncbi:MAG: gamma-glutamyl-gamma-aminobutyrate hydrolase family protein [Tissierellaceae bacterium]